jgi:hypothetical protein
MVGGIAVGVFIRLGTAADLAPGPGQQRCWRPACFPVWSPWQPLAVQDALPGTFIMSLDENFIKTLIVSYWETLGDFHETAYEVWQTAAREHVSDRGG